MGEFRYGRAACTLVLREDGRVLAVSRRGTTDQFGIPGGKCDEGETFEAAAIRETREETGIEVRNLRRVLERPCRNDANRDEFHTVTFRADYDGEPRACEAGMRVEWVTWEQLFAGPFGDYNRQLWEAVRER